MNNIYVYRMHTYKTLYFFVFTSYLFLVVNMDNLFRWLNCGYNWWSSQDTFMSKWFHSWWILNDSCPCLKCISFFFFTSRCYFNWLSSSIMRLWLVYNEVWLPRVAAELPKKKLRYTLTCWIPSSMLTIAIYGALQKCIIYPWHKVVISYFPY